VLWGNYFGLGIIGDPKNGLIFAGGIRGMSGGLNFTKDLVRAIQIFIG